MKKITFLLVLFLVVALSACGDSDEDKEEKGSKDAPEAKIDDKVWNDIQESGELVVGTPGTLFPASYYPEDSDELTGYDVEIAKEISERLGLNVTFEVMGFDAMLTALNTGRVDIILAGPREESKKKFAFSEPVKYSYSTMIVRSEDLSGIETLEDLKGKKAGGAATTVYSDIARKFDAEVITYGNVTNDAYLRDVENGRTDLVINDYYLQSLALTAFPDLNIELHPDLKFHPTTNNVVVDKDADTLLKKVNQVIDEMREDGTLTEKSVEFFGGQDVSVKPEDEIIEIEGIE